MRILAVIPCKKESTTGMIFARRQNEQLKKYNIKVDTFFLESRSFSIGILKEALKLRKQIKKTKPDVIHAHYGTITALLSSIVAGRTPMITAFRGSDLNLDLGVPIIRRYLGHILSQLAAAFSNRIICVSDRLKQLLWFNKGKVFIITDGVDTSLFKPRNMNQARAELNLNPTNPIIIFNNNHDPVKRIDVAQDTINILKKDFPNLQFIIFNGNITPNDMPKYLNAANAILLTSDSEGSPVIIKESLASGLPIVAVDVGDVPFMLDGVTNCFVESRNPQELANKLKIILTNKERSNGDKHFKKYCYQIKTNELVNLYKEITQ